MKLRSKLPLTGLLLGWMVLASSALFATAVFATEEEMPLDNVRAYSPDAQMPEKPGGSRWSHAFGRPDARRVLLHVHRIVLGPMDRFEISTPEFDLLLAITTSQGERWLPAFETSAVRVDLIDQPDGVRAYAGVDAVAYGREPLEPATLCNNPSQLKDITCLKDEQPCEDVFRYASGEAVARLTFKVRNNTTGDTLLIANNCTGWLVKKDLRRDLLLTAKHCMIRTNRTMLEVQAEFNAEYGNGTMDCQQGGPGCGVPNQACMGSPVIKGSRFYNDPVCDWSMIRLDANGPAVLELAANSSQAGDVVYIPQHPSGRCKEIDDGTIVAATVGCDPPNGNLACETGHRVDTEGGSSGSPVLLDVVGRPDRHKVVALHNCGGCAPGNATSYNNAVDVEGIKRRLTLACQTVDGTVPVELSDLQVESNAGGVTLRWRLSDIARGQIEQLEVERAESFEGPYENLTPSGLSPEATSFTDAEVVAGHTYWYRILLHESSGALSLAGPLSVLAARPGSSTGLHSVQSRRGGPAEIRYAIGRTGTPMRLEVFGVSGRRVRVIESRVRDAGEFLVTWDRRDDAGRDTGRGVFLVRLTAGGASFARKLLVVHD